MSLVRRSVLPATPYSSFGGTSDNDFNNGGPWGCPSLFGGTQNCTLSTHQHLQGDNETSYIQKQGSIIALLYVDPSIKTGSDNVPFTWGFKACHNNPGSSVQVITTVGAQTFTRAVSQCPEVSPSLQFSGTLGPKWIYNNSFEVVVYSSVASKENVSATLNLGDFHLDLGTSNGSTSSNVASRNTLSPAIIAAITLGALFGVCLIAFVGIWISRKRLQQARWWKSVGLRRKAEDLYRGGEVVTEERKGTTPELSFGSKVGDVDNGSVVRPLDAK